MPITLTPNSSPSAANSTLTLVDVRRRLRLAGRNTNDPTYYTNAMLDEAIDRLCARFLRVTRCVKIATTVDLDSTANTADFLPLSGFLVDRIERARITLDSNYTAAKVCEDLNVVNVSDVYDHQSHCGTSTGTPKMMGFLDTTTATFFPPAKYDGTIDVTYSPMQVPWTIGTMGAWSGSVTYQVFDVVSHSGSLFESRVPNNTDATTVAASWTNLGVGTLIAPEDITNTIPDGLLIELIGTGGPPMLQAVDPEHQAFVGPAWASYLAFEQSCTGIGSISGKTSARASLGGRRW